MKTQSDNHMDIREPLRALLAEFDDAYHRKHGAEGTYPSEFVEALTREGKSVCRTTPTT